MSPMVSEPASALARIGAEHRAQPTRRAALRSAGVAVVGSACVLLRGCTTAPGERVSLEQACGALAERYTRLALQLARQQPSLVDAWFGPAAWFEGPRVAVPALRADAKTLLQDIEQLSGLPPAAEPRTDGYRGVWAGTDADAGPAASTATRLGYLRGQIRALDAAAGRLLGESQSFADEALRTLGHAPPPRNIAALDALRQELAEALPPGAGTLAERHAAFRRAMAVPPDRVEAVFAAAVDWCRTAAREVLPLPPGEVLTTRAADESGWAAFARPTAPRASDAWVARRGGADAAHLLQLAAHEGTPGHHAQHVLAAVDLVDGLGWTERALHPAFGPHRLLAEGAAEAGADLLLPDDVRDRVCRELLLPAAGQPAAMASRLVQVERRAAALGVEVAHIAQAYLDSSLPMEAMSARLRDEALVLDPPGMLSFIEKQRAKVLAYPLGRQLVRQALDAVPDASNWARFREISTTLHLG